MTTCKRRTSIANVPIAAGGSVELTIPSTAAEYTIRVDDGTGAGVAWSLAVRGAPAVMHFDAGATWTEERLTLDAQLVLVVAAAPGSTVELVLWEG